MAELTLDQETALRVRDLQVKFEAFETQNKISGNYFNEFDEELEEGRVSLEKLEKRVRELETDLPELIVERVATLKTENAELRIHLNSLVDAVNNLTRIWNEQVHEGEQQTEVADVQTVEDNDVLFLPQGDDKSTTEDSEPPLLTLQQIYNMYHSQPLDDEAWEEMAKTDETSGSPQ